VAGQAAEKFQARIPRDPRDADPDWRIVIHQNLYLYMNMHDVSMQIVVSGRPGAYAV
jgi:hypothetical protein